MSESGGDTPDSAPDDLSGLDYEEARDQLVEVVRELEAGGLSLEQSLALWERGEKLARLCETHLAGARERIEAALATVEDDSDAGDAAGGSGGGSPE
ncbi:MULTISPECIES: exodeoxyribonuclease VII small subunit [Prauserella salsuginis group]|uniref:Exodeoxyribonuclease 7 small subunit n=1 Tax=Prauserella salsuginis TaxID=387889 RepID=A0ABW6GBE4_9PSEU|nr:MULTISPECIES: exodeoxyribonuclease VII small subunit [Prauserella salsuginis group]MCR3722425.1 Exodeoxyribonuclease VII small subunit [Prauserella flava]MCR3736867.1 Exodeoxyribonuclease VII small subunit [Prauserella salsuginis]